ncbi:ABC transporter [Ilyonectria sp. MPI-CAGE-AT-0026]|nr:ABC transporter [Ilyonectria sp. MPI-CAGE-AT-0026]
MSQHQPRLLADCRDDKFGPWAGILCRGGFDFTLFFEESILSISVQAIFLLLLPIWAWQVARTDVKVAGGIVRPIKTIGLLCLVALNAALLALWVKTDDDQITHTRATLANAVLTLIASLGACVLSWLEHERNPKPSFIVTSWLFFSGFLDLARSRTLWMIGDGYQTIPVLLTCSLVLRLILLVLESLGKRHLLVPQYKDSERDITRTLFETVLFWWLNPLLAVGYKRNIALSDLYPLEKDMHSDDWHKNIAEAWEKVPDKTVPGVLFNVSIRALAWPLMTCVPPRLLQIGFTYVQPIMIKQAVTFAATPQGKPYDNYGYGLVGAFAIVYTCLAICLSQYQWRVSRVSAKLRGGIMALIFQESLQLDVTSPDISSTGAITLLNTDANNMIEAVHMIHEIWANCAEIGIAIYLVQREMGAACAMPIALAASLMFIAVFIAVPSGTAQAAWIQASQERVTATSKTLSSVKWLKISGLSDVTFGVIRRLRVRELKISITYRILLGVTLVLLTFSSVWSPILTFCLYAGLAKRNGTSIDVPTVFAAYSALSLLNGPITWVMLAFPTMAGSLQSFQRVQNHLNGKKRVDNREALMNRPQSINQAEKSDTHLMLNFEQIKAPEGHFELSDMDQSSAPSSIIMEKGFIASVHGKFSWAEDEEPVLDIEEWNIQRRTLTMVLGPVGCGKSTLLKGLLGELGGFKGTIRANFSGAAYCDQSPWIPNDTVRNIIIGGSDWDEAWYQRVLHACALEHDLLTWPKGHDTVAGSQGISMSGGQKQRLSIARAVYSRREFLIMDDVLSSLDSSTEEFIFQSLWGEKGLLWEADITTVLTSSDERRVHSAGQLVILNERGQISGRGTPDELQDVLSHVEIKSNGNKTGKKHGASAPEDNGAIGALAELPTADVDDPTRRLGNWEMYSLYTQAAGKLTLGLFILAMAVYAFCASFPSVWLGWWAKKAAEEGTKNLGKWLGVYVVLGVGSLVGSTCGIWQLIVVIINKCGLHFHEALLETVSRAPMAFHSAVDSGITVNRFSEDLRLIDMELPTAAFGVSSTMAFLFAQVIIVAVTSRYLAVAFPVLLFMLYVIQHFYLRTSRQLRLLDIECMAPVNSQLIETLDGLVSIRAFQWDQNFLQKSLVVIDNSQRPRYLLASIQGWLSYHIDMVITLLAIIFVILTTTLREEIGANYMGIGLNSVLGLGSATKTVLSFWVMLEVSLGAVMRVHQFTKETEKEGAHDDPFHDEEHAAWPTQGAVELNGVTASYESSGICLDNISFSIQPGQKVAICGRTGSGKSSLTLCLLRLMDLDSGSIAIDGVNLTRLSHEYVRNKLVALPQQVFIMDASVRLNADPSETVGDEEIISALQRVQLWPKIEKRGGLDTVVDDNFFSQGEGQLLVFARAMLRKSKVLILDEFTSSLDQTTSQIVEELLVSFFNDWTIIAVTHKLDSVLTFDRVAVLERGRLLEFDEPRKLLEQQDSAFKTLYETHQQSEYTDSSGVGKS